VPIQVAQLGVSITCFIAPQRSEGLYMPATSAYQALGDPICGIALTPLEDMAGAVTEHVSGLVDAGEVLPGLGNALIKQFERAVEKLNQGKTAPAMSMLNDLIDQVNELINDGQISDAEGQNLIALATALLP
jgi:hypothetical protein